MRILAVVFAAITTAFAIYCWQFETYDFSGTRWRCSETKAGFTSAAYRQYQSIEEYTTIYFPSNTSVIYYQSGMLNHKSGLKEPYELVLTAKNKVNGQFGNVVTDQLIVLFLLNDPLVGGDGAWPDADRTDEEIVQRITFGLLDDALFHVAHVLIRCSSHGHEHSAHHGVFTCGLLFISQKNMEYTNNQW